MDEIWVEIPDFERYQVSNRGRVKNGTTNRLLALQHNQSGTVFVTLTAYGKKRTLSVALLVAEQFVPNPFLAAVDLWPFNTPTHLDGDHFNNEAYNLVWRPRWLAIMYQQQFFDHRIKYKAKIIETTTGLVFQNSWNAARHFGILEKDIVLTMFNRHTTWFGLEFKRYE